MLRPEPSPGAAYDLVLAGGGLQNGLIALSALHARPERRIALVEHADRLGGNHTWCVHARDVPAGARAWFEPLIVRRWSAYDVHFPGFSRTVGSAYAVVSSERFAQVVGARLASQPRAELFLQRRAVSISKHSVQLDRGELLHGRRVVDARGPDPRAYSGRCGFQKFVGLELRLRAPHSLSRPILMDATCEQVDGFRFFYVLPLAEDRVLVEETRFSLSAELDVAGAHRAIYAYAERFGAIAQSMREEQGVLPMPWSMPPKLPAPDAPAADAPLVAGYRGGYFHPATGYSMPAALRVAEVLGAGAEEQEFDRQWQALARAHDAQATYALHLNRLLFTGFAETDMWGVFARFYHLPEALIERFYALSSTAADRVRIVIGRPPAGFSLRRALSHLVSARERGGST